jgi:hypothetical protein
MAHKIYTINSKKCIRKRVMSAECKGCMFHSTRNSIKKCTKINPSEQECVDTIKGKNTWYIFKSALKKCKSHV